MAVLDGHVSSIEARLGIRPPAHTRAVRPRQAGERACRERSSPGVALCCEADRRVCLRASGAVGPGANHLSRSRWASAAARPSRPCCLGGRDGGTPVRRGRTCDRGGGDFGTSASRPGTARGAAATTTAGAGRCGGIAVDRPLRASSSSFPATFIAVSVLFVLTRAPEAPRAVLRGAPLAPRRSAGQPLAHIWRAGRVKPRETERRSRSRRRPRSGYSSSRGGQVSIRSAAAAAGPTRRGRESS